MSLYEKYTLGWEDKPYVTGRDDCYGLVRKWLAANYGMKLTNYARPLAWDDHGFNLLGDFFEREGFNLAIVPLNRLELGDLLLMRVATRGGVANHIGVYVGNGYLLHHLYAAKSKADPLNDRWKARVLDVLRHPEVSAKNVESIEQVDMMTLLPPHLRDKYARATQSTVEPTR